MPLGEQLLKCLSGHEFENQMNPFRQIERVQQPHDVLVTQRLQQFRLFEVELPHFGTAVAFVRRHLLDGDFAVSAAAVDALPNPPHASPSDRIVEAVTVRQQFFHGLHFVGILKRPGGHDGSCADRRGLGDHRTVFERGAVKVKERSDSADGEQSENHKFPRNPAALLAPHAREQEVAVRVGGIENPAPRPRGGLKPLKPLRVQAGRPFQIFGELLGRAEPFRDDRAQDAHLGIVGRDAQKMGH